MAKKKQSTVLFDEPEGSFLGEGEVIKKYNEELEQNPDMVLPDGYKKTKERVITFQYVFNDKLASVVPENILVAFETLNDIIFDNPKIGTQLIEPSSIVQEVVRAHPLLNAGFVPQSKYANIHFANHGYDIQKYPLPPANSKFEPSDKPVSQERFNEKGEFRKYMKDRATKSQAQLYSILPGSTFDIVKEKYGTKKNLPITQYNSLTLGMKLSISNLNYKDRWIGQECAYVLDDLVKAIEKDRKNVLKEGLFHPTNAVVEDKKAKTAKKQETEEQKKKRVENLRQFNLQRTDKDKEENEPKKQEEKTKKEEEIAKQKEDADKKQKNREKWLEDQKNKAQEHTVELKQKKEEQDKEKQEKEKQKKDEFNKKFNEFNESEKTKLKDKFDKLQAERREKADAERKKQQDLKPKREKLYKNLMQTEQKRKDFEKESDCQVKEMHQSLAPVFKNQDKKLKQIFALLKKWTFTHLAQQQTQEITLKTWSWFCFSFKFYPEILHSLDTILIFRSVVKEKELMKVKEEQKVISKAGGVLPIGMNYEEWKEALSRVAIKGKNVFNKFAQKLNDGVTMNQTAMNDIVDNQDVDGDGENGGEQDPNKTQNNMTLDEQQQTIERYKLLVDSYGDISQTNQQTLECLLLYLGFPEDQLGIEERFRQVMENKNTKANRKKKLELQSKMGLDPKSFVYERIDPNKSMLNKNNIPENDGEDLVDGEGEGDRQQEDLVDQD